ncbi:MAG: hypothetical protein NZM12_06795 [Steroidobacteraceae bacterium]|nr:hypothetical protein [Steroidobacteraceae bacterium]MDW8258854.1 hypothetical protein [Gammaproteobacteria bacterium]
MTVMDVLAIRYGRSTAVVLRRGEEAVIGPLSPGAEIVTLCATNWTRFEFGDAGARVREEQSPVLPPNAWIDVAVAYEDRYVALQAMVDKTTIWIMERCKREERYAGVH